MPRRPTWPVAERITKWSSGCWKTLWMSLIWSGGKGLTLHSVIHGHKWKHKDSVSGLWIQFVFTSCHTSTECCVLRRLTGKEKRVGGFDLMWNGGPVHRDDVIPATCGSSYFPSNTHLGNLTLLQEHSPDKSISRPATISMEDILFLTNGCKKSLLQDVWMTERHSFDVFSNHLQPKEDATTFRKSNSNARMKKELLVKDEV